jgi:hypothetical protein
MEESFILADISWLMSIGTFSPSFHPSIMEGGQDHWLEAVGGMWTLAKRMQTLFSFTKSALHFSFVLLTNL